MNTEIPNNPTAEQLVIGCCLAGGSQTANLVVAQASEDDFLDIGLSASFRVIRSLVGDGSSVDAVSLVQRWRREIEFPPSPTEAVLEAESKVPSKENVFQYISDLKEATKRRLAWTVGNSLAQKASDPKREIAEAISCAIQALEGGDDSRNDDVADGTAATEILIADLERRHALGGKLAGISTGFDRLDELTEGLQEQELSVIGARPSQGKSALLLQLAAHAGLRKRVPTLIVSLEMSTASLLRRMASLETEIPLGTLRSGKLSEVDFGKLANFNARLRKAPVWIFDGTIGSNVNRIAGIVRWHVRKHGVKLVVLDYLQKVRPTTRHEKRTYEVAEVSGALKALAVRHHLHVCAAAQLNREPDKGDSRPPRLSDLADSGQVERDADLVALLHRQRTEEDSQGRQAKLIVAKQRDGELGTVRLDFNGSLCRFEQ